MQFLDKTGLAHVLSKIVAKFVPVTRTINGKALNANITLAAADVSAVPTTRKINNKALSADITLSATDVSAVPTTRTINGKALSSNITLSASDVSARSNTWVPALTDCTGTLTITKGGTGATNAANARTNLGITPANIGAAPSEHTHKYLDAYSGTGTVGFGISDSGFWARAQRDGINAEYLYMTKDGQKVYTYNSEGTYVQTLHGTTNVLYSSTQPIGQFKGQLWLKPV